MKTFMMGIGILMVCVLALAAPALALTAVAGDTMPGMASGESWLLVLGALALGTVVTPEDIKKLGEEFQGLVKQLRTENETLLQQGKDTRKEWNEKTQKLQDRLDEIETKLNRPPVPADRDVEHAGRAIADILAVKRLPAYLKKWYGRPAEERAKITGSYDSYLRKGLDQLGPEERKVLTLADDTGGGYLATPETASEIIKGEVEFSPVREVARIRTTSARSVRIRKRTGTFAAVWVSETGTKAETAGLKYGLEEVPVHEMYALVDVAEQDLEDSDFNLEAELNMEFSEQFGVAEGTAFISGNGVGKPEGIFTNAAIGQVNSGDANLMTADGVIKLFYGLKDAYAKNGVFMMKRSTIQAVRLLKGSDNNYLWQPGLAGTLPPSLLGRPYVEAVDIDAVAANKLVIAFGDFKRGYLIVDRTIIAVKRDPFTQATSGAVRFIARKRVAGQVVNTEAIKIQKVAA